MNTQEAAEKWGYTRKQINYMCSRGIIKAEKVTGKKHGRTDAVWDIPNDTEPPKLRNYNPRAKPIEPGEANQTVVDNRQYIMAHQDRENLRTIARNLGLSVEEVRRIYDEEINRRIRKWR